jgi:hypothetical protein
MDAPSGLSGVSGQGWTQRAYLFLIFCLHPNLITGPHVDGCCPHTGIFDWQEQETLNWYRHFKEVHSIGDIVCSNGHTINPNMLTQEAGQSSRDFPLQVPTVPDHKLWLKMIHSLTQAGH